MMSILVVDDEAVIADGIHEMVRETFDGRLIAYKAYSATQAQRLVSERPIDILMTDIDMPGMSGLELHAWIRKRWPLCIVLYLTGYSEFDYVRQALDQQAIAYVLKSDGDKAIVAALERAILEAERRQERLLEDAALKLAGPVYLRECVERIIRSDSTEADRAQWFRSWKITINPSAQAMFALCIFKEGTDSAFSAMRTLGELSPPSLRLLMAPVSNNLLAVIAQTEPSNDMALFSGTLSTLQRTMVEKEGFAFITAPESVDWNRLQETYRSMVGMISHADPNPGEQHVLVGDGQTVPRRVPLVDEVNEYIRAHLSEDISLQRIAEAVHYHPAYLSRIYKESCGLGLSDYTINLRMVEARRMLLESRLRVNDIAQRLGFTTATYFTRFFRKHQGITPQAYRDECAQMKG
jgi:two-component system response regulator YesN